MVFTPVVKVRNQKQRANANRKAAEREVKIAENAARKAKKKLRNVKSSAPEMTADELTKVEKRSIKEGHRQRILDAVKKGAICVEIGVWRGNFSSMILETVKPLNLALVDPWQKFKTDDQSEAFAGQIETDRIEEIYESVQEKFSNQIENGQVTIMREFSTTAIAQYSNDTIDFAYIDGDHSYDGVKADLNNILPKMKEEGIIALDDYHRFGWWGDDVLRAIHDFIGENPTTVRIFMVEGAQFALTKLGPMENADT
ncbi:class I SAM-dependent methyltransferase [Tenacibaculum finnmarkense]|uniref:class I SAM-dependent methyltransferase n=1 Tax=Tenacibaculum finnmarkense TaxID=2781243 RepID=UPI001EFB7005|nr:class I SAM-dependent methyltransferase [Tenacibaculum finnmarkense]MCG8239821.1 class I SAM-dependent methyltransferase [Tenacibaculum finnmarkense genomovar ulcerans]